MGAGGDVNQIVFIFGMKGMAAGEIVQAGVNLFEVPRVADRDFYADDFRFRRDAGDIQATVFRILDFLLKDEIILSLFNDYRAGIFLSLER